MDEGQDYAVGYGKPPTHRQYKKGQSGNPRGRPRKPAASTMDDLILQSLEIEIEVKIGGKTRRMTRREAIVERAIADVLGGKKGAVKTLGDLRNLPMLKREDSSNQYDEEAASKILEWVKQQDLQDAADAAHQERNIEEQVELRLAARLREG